MLQNRAATTAERLKEALAISGMKQIDLARKTGLDKGSISYYISGKYEPKAKAIHKLAIALDVSDMWLWGYDVPRERTAMHKKNETIGKLVSKLRKDDDFLTQVEILSKLSQEQYDSIKQLLGVFSNK